MKIIYCLFGTFNPGGMERMVIAKANALAERGHKVIIVTSDQDGRPDFFPLDRRVRRLDANVMYSANNNRNPFGKFFSRRHKIQLHKRFVAHLISSFNPDVIVSTVGNEVDFIPEIAGNAATVAEIHFSKFYRLQKRRKGLWHLIDRYLTHTDARSLARYDRFVVLTNDDARHWKDSANIAIIPNFITTSPKQPSQLSQKRVIAVGRLDFQKNYGEMIEVWNLIHKDHPDWTLEIYGQGPERARLQNLIDRNGLGDSVLLKGTMPPESDVYSGASLLLHTARYEGFPLVLLEALSAGLPVVAYDCPCGPAEIIENGVTGFLIPQDDRAAMVKALGELMQDEELRRQMGKTAKEHASRFAPRAIIDRWENLFSELTHTK